MPTVRTSVEAAGGTPNRKKCLTPDCEKIPAWRGLCNDCHKEAKHLVESKATTWEQLGQMGLALVPGTTVSKFSKAFKAKTSELGDGEEGGK